MLGNQRVSRGDGASCGALRMSQHCCLLGAYKLRNLAASGLLPVVFVLSGCTAYQNITYDLKQVSVLPNTRFSTVDLAVLEFEDARPPELVRSKLRRALLFEDYYFQRSKESGKQGWYFNSSENYRDGKIARQLSEMIARHLAASKLFRQVSFAGAGAEAGWHTLRGTIKEFRGYKKPSLVAEASMRMGLVGGLLGTAAEAGGMSTPYEGRTVLVELRLVHADGKTIIWQGDTVGYISGQSPIEPTGWGAYRIANLSLKEAVEELVKKLAESAVAPSRAK